MANSTSKPQTESSVAPRDPHQQARRAADALYRSAVECCRQHDRAARMAEDEETELEHKHVDALCALCHESLTEIANAYGELEAGITVKDEPWVQKAHALLVASRDYGRRQAESRSSLQIKSGKHGAEKLAGMQMEYELAASALLSLRHAADAYKKTRTGLG